jgi:hypothetical protein
MPVVVLLHFAVILAVGDEPSTLSAMWGRGLK